MLAGDENHLTAYKRSGFCESSRVLKPIHLCVLSCKVVFNLSHAPGMARRVGQLVNWAVKRPVAPTVPHVMSGSPLDPLAMTSATSSYAHAPVSPQGAEMDPGRLSAALDELLLLR